MQSWALSRKTARLLFNLYLARFTPADVEGTTRQIVRLGLCGAQELVDGFRATLLGEGSGTDTPCPSLSLHSLPCEDPKHHWQLLEDCQMAFIFLGREQLLDDTIYKVKETLPKRFKAVWVAVGEIEPWLQYETREVARDLKLGSVVFARGVSKEDATPIFKALVRACNGQELALARKFEILRAPVVHHVIHRVARQNFMVAMASSLPNTVPFVGPLLGLLGVSGEIIFITSNQMRLALQIASVYGLDLQDRQRLQELLPILASAFGWRLLSRQLSGFVPVVGPGIKGGVAYAGTVAVGAATLWFYQTGTYLDEAAQADVYQQALEEASTLTESTPS